MTIADMHRIDVKAALQKKFGSVASFERKHDLPEKSVNDVLRGRPWKRVADAIEKALATEEGTPAESEFSDCSKGCATSHRLIEGAR